MNGVTKALVACVAAALISGCSAVRVGYENADTFLRWRATSYLDVHGEDSDELDDAIDGFLAWHRAQALPQYARLMDEAASRLADGLSPEDLVWGYDSLVAQVRESARVAATKIAPLLDRLNDEQLAHIERRFADDNRKFAREYLRGSEQQRRKRRFERNVDRIEDGVGRLSPEQRERVRLYSERAPLFDGHRDRDRKRLQAEFMSIVRAREARKRLPDAAAGWDRGRDAEYAAASRTLMDEFRAMLLDLDRTLSAGQRAHALQRLRGFAGDFAVLARP